MDMASAKLRINGETCEADVALYDTLLTILRDKMQLTGAKRGCNQGVCGACTVLADGVPVRACLSLALDCEGKEIQTIEGSSDDWRMQVLQRAFVEHGAFQCAFCTPGMLTSAHALLSSRHTPTEAEIRKALSGNLCRCTGYKKIVEAVLEAASELQGGAR
jgi:carbon-monoxide dehydrogenase small subunit